MAASEQRRCVSIVGAGRVGTTLAVLLYRAGYPIVSILSRKRNSARQLAHLVGCKQYSSSLSQVSSSTRILLIATPEESVLKIAKELARQSHLEFQSLSVFHTSGMLTSDALLPLRKKGAKVFSLHPIQAFPKRMDRTYQLQRMQNVCYGYEGSQTTWRQAQLIVKVFGGEIIRIPKEKKILYHIACVVASNYSVALLGMVEEVLALVGGDVRLKHFAPLIKTSIENAILLTPKKALTGPIARGSISTIECHLRELFKKDKRLALQYRQLGRQVLQWISIQKMLTQETKQKLKKILESN